MFRLIPGNIVDMSTLIRSVNVLDHIGKIDTDFILSDAGYYTTSDINELYDANIDFLMRLPEKYNLYKDLVKKYATVMPWSDLLPDDLKSRSRKKQK